MKKEEKEKMYNIMVVFFLGLAAVLGIYIFTSLANSTEGSIDYSESTKLNSEVTDIETSKADKKSDEIIFNKLEENVEKDKYPKIRESEVKGPEFNEKGEMISIGEIVYQVDGIRFIDRYESKSTKRYEVVSDEEFDRLIEENNKVANTKPELPVIENIPELPEKRKGIYMSDNEQNKEIDMLFKYGETIHYIDGFPISAEGYVRLKGEATTETFNNYLIVDDKIILDAEMENITNMIIKYGDKIYAPVIKSDKVGQYIDYEVRAEGEEITERFIASNNTNMYGGNHTRDILDVKSLVEAKEKEDLELVISKDKEALNEIYKTEFKEKVNRVSRSSLEFLGEYYIYLIALIGVFIVSKIKR